MNVAYTVWTWHLDPFNGFKKSEDPQTQRVEFEKGLREIQYLGYNAVEDMNMIVSAFGDCPEKLRSLLEKYHMKFSAIYHYMKTDFDYDLELLKRCIALAKEIDCKKIIIQPPKIRPEGNTREDVLETARKANIMAQYTYAAGLDLCVHPHYNDTVLYRDEIDLFAENTDPEKVKFCFDTAHATIADINPVDLLEAYKDRIGYIHFKDVDPDPTLQPGQRPMDRFRALGQGFVDFKGVYKKLLEIGYEDTICVELDYPIIANYQSAQFSREYLRSVIGV
ncbi:MAG TPA: sugar phosphate isomerase/epimerase [Candidatus Faecousia faecavium]|nr:sugar phosphate isomerase/epimerase [Candidatus Faecousia faecavium]